MIDERKDKLTWLMAMLPDGGIGCPEGIPWTCKEDMDHFVDLTMGEVVIVSRRTWETIPNRLRGRTVLVMSENWTDESMAAVYQDWCHPTKSIEEALFRVKWMSSNNSAYVIGGKKLYLAFLEHYTDAIITNIPDIACTHQPDLYMEPGFFKNKDLWKYDKTKLGNIISIDYYNKV